MKKISWIIETNNSKVSQHREHTENYKDKITNLQSKYVALHVALFWGIGTFNIKNEDSIKIKEIKTENGSYSVRSLNCNYKFH